jgi:hypothetical protein
MWRSMPLQSQRPAAKVSRVTADPVPPTFSSAATPDKAFDTVAPIDTPRGFRWVDGPNRFSRDYSAETPPERTADGRGR